MWKQKYDAQTKHFSQIKQNYELEIQSLSQELSRMHQMFSQIDDKKKESDHYLFKGHQENNVINELKRSQFAQSANFEHDMKRFREQLEDKNNQLSEAQTKFERLRCEQDSLVQRHKAEVQSFNYRISELELQHQAQISQIKQKYDFYAQTSTKTQSYAHNNQVELLNEEIGKLLQLINIKNTEINSLLQQSQVSKVQNEAEQDCLRKEIQELQLGFQIQDRQNEIDKLSYYDSVDKKFQQQAQALKSEHQMEQSDLNNELLHFKHLSEQKKQEIDALLNEKARQKQYYDEELTMLQKDNEKNKQRFDARDQEKQREIQDLHQRIERINQNHSENERQNYISNNNLEQEISVLKETMYARGDEIESLKRELSQKTNIYDNMVNQLKQEVEQTHSKLSMNDKDKAKSYDELFNKMIAFDIQYKDKVRLLEQNIESLQEQNIKLNQQLQHKTKELDNISAQNYLIEHENQRIRIDRDKLLEKINRFEQEKIIEMEELHFKMEGVQAYQIDHLKGAFNTQFSILQSELTDLRQQLAQKQRDYIELLEHNQDLGKSLRNRHDLSASKSVYDSVVQSRRLSITRNK